MVEAAKRRCQEELGIKVDLRFLYKFSYEAEFEDAGSEKRTLPRARWSFGDGTMYKQKQKYSVEMDITEELDEELHYRGANFTPWLKMEWEAITRDHIDQIVDN